MSRRSLRLAVARRAGDSTEEDESESESEESESEESDYGYDHTLTAAAIQVFNEDEVEFNLGIEGSRETFVAALRRVQNDNINYGKVTLSINYQDRTRLALDEIWNEIIDFKKRIKHFKEINFSNRVSQMPYVGGSIQEDVLDKFCQLLAEGSDANIDQLQYYCEKPMLGVRKLAAAIRSTSTSCGIIGNFQTNVDSRYEFESFFRAVLGSGILGFEVEVGFNGSDGAFNATDTVWQTLVTNTSLKTLHLDRDPAISDLLEVRKDIAERLLEVIKTNHRLEEIRIRGSMLNNAGRRSLLEVLKSSNGTLLRFPLYTSIYQVDDDQREEAEIIQHEIDAVLKTNRAWKRYEANSKVLLSPPSSGETKDKDEEKTSHGGGSPPSVREQVDASLQPFAKRSPTASFKRNWRR